MSRTIKPRVVFELEKPDWRKAKKRARSSRSKSVSGYAKNLLIQHLDKIP